MYCNILINKLPQHTDSGLRIRTDFRESIKFELLMQDRTIDDDKKIKMILNLYYYRPEQIVDIKKALEEIIWFYKGGDKIQTKNIKKNNEENNRGKQIYSYESDAEYIYSAFLQQYKIDLNSIKYLHWWKFRALFINLNENVLFSKIMKYRATELKGIKDKEMKKFYKKMKRIYALPDMRTEEEKESDFARAFM